MQDVIKQLDKNYAGNMRLSIAVLLYSCGSLSHAELKDRASTTDGNIASHIRSLEQCKYVRVSKSIVDRKTHTAYALTTKGKSALLFHVKALRVLVDSVM